MYEVIKNVGVPEKVRRGFPFGDLEVGDAFEFEEEKRQRVSSAASVYHVKTGRKFVTRKQQDGRLLCIRIL